MLRPFALAALLLSGAVLSAQAPAPRPASGPGEIRGKLVGSVASHAVTSGSVTIRRQPDSVFAGGALPRADGSFRVDGLVPGRYSLRVRAIGYAPFARNDIIITAEKPEVDLGALTLTVVAATLEKQTVTAERDATVLAPDRNSYSTKNMAVASGGTAIDVLRNIPLVEVDGSNKVTLRGNENVVIQINGRSTPLKGDQLSAFLAQLPSSTVKNIEVATNPSAKDDPEGTAGIINIVLSQEAELGLSGGVSASTSTSGQVSGSGNIGKQQGKLTLYAQAGFYSDPRVTSGRISRTNLVIPVPVFVETASDGRQHPRSLFSTVRSEYRFDDRTSLSLDSYAGGGHFGGDNFYDYTDLDGSRAVIGLFNQQNNSLSRNFYQDYDLTFRRQTPQGQPVYSAEVEYSNNNNTNDADLSGNLVQPDPSTPASIPTERDHAVGKFPFLTFKTDFTHPFGTHAKLEGGFKGQQRTTSNDFSASYLNPSTGAYDAAPLRATAFDYRETISGVYGLFSQQVDKVQLQAGLRLEDARTRLNLPLNGIDNNNHYGSVYPSAIVSYNLTDFRQVKLSYSRRVSRPNPFQLSPIEFRQDSRNVFHGNPNLRPEYTDAMELSLQDAHSWGSLQLNPYVRHTSHAVRNIQFVDANGVSVSTYDNVAGVTYVGTDANVNYRHGAFTVFGGGSTYHYSSDASNLTGNLSARALVWSTRANVTWKVSQLVDAQVFANYRAPFATEGGSTLASANVNGGIRYKIWGDQGSIYLRIADPFAIAKYGYRTANGTVLEYSERYFGSRALYITIQRNFGQALKLRPKSDPDVAAPAAGVP